MIVRHRPCRSPHRWRRSLRLSADDRRSLKRVLQRRRAAISPVTRGFPPWLPGPGRRGEGLGQEQTDELLARARGTYNRLENGRLAHPGADLLTAVAQVLGLDEHECGPSSGG
ncbi:helix-turn-helix transcriptional regulator [Streptomyces sp. NPDC047974]|uniref:helix-turn-helix domain-containing protein n=1 Tax=Streptomyces sp. NPDC047974 TaxID=3154343 RepID=UPI003404DA7D